MKSNMLVIVTVLVLSGCGEKVYDASYFQENHEKAEEMIKKCDSGEVTGQNCDNARTGLDDYKAKKLSDHLEGKGS